MPSEPGMEPDYADGLAASGDDALEESPDAVTMIGDATVDQLLTAARERLEQDRRHAGVLEKTDAQDVAAAGGHPVGRGAGRNFWLAITALEEATWRATNGYLQLAGAPELAEDAETDNIDTQRRVAAELEAKGIPF